MAGTCDGEEACGTRLIEERPRNDNSWGDANFVRNEAPEPSHRMAACLDAQDSSTRHPATTTVWRSPGRAACDLDVIVDVVWFVGGRCGPPQRSYSYFWRAQQERAALSTQGLGSSPCEGTTILLNFCCTHCRCCRCFVKQIGRFGVAVVSLAPAPQHCAFGSRKTGLRACSMLCSKDAVCGVGSSAHARHGR